MTRTHFHLYNENGAIFEHAHSSPGRAHEHDGFRLYATSRRVIERLQAEYRAARKARLSRKPEPRGTPGGDRRCQACGKGGRVFAFRHPGDRQSYYLHPACAEAFLKRDLKREAGEGG